MFHQMSSINILLNNKYLSCLPKIYSVLDYSHQSTAGTGRSSLARVSALGEHLERFVFRNFSTCLPRNRISTGNICADWNWVDVFSQLAAREVSSAEIQQLNLVRVWCITTSQERLIPEILVSLEGLPDHQLFPSADTSGCAVHSDPNKCTDNALLEFCERQASFASWYGPWTTTEITHSKITSSHLEAIANCGRIRLFDIGGPFGVPILLSIFQSESSSSLVKFAAGLGAAWDRREAITKSLNELYQLYELTYFSAKGEIRDPHNLLQHNCHESAVNWPFIGQQPNSKISELTYLSIEMPERAGLIERLEKSGIRVQIFLDRLQLPSASLYVAKVLSPDAFLSSMGKLHNNYNNRFSQTSFINSDKSRPCILF